MEYEPLAFLACVAFVSLMFSLVLWGVAWLLCQLFVWLQSQLHLLQRSIYLWLQWFGAKMYVTYNVLRLTLITLGKRPITIALVVAGGYGAYRLHRWWRRRRRLANRMVKSQQWRIMPTIYICFHCSTEGTEMPLERCVQLPCCGYSMCRACWLRKDNHYMCLECLKRFPPNEVNAARAFETMEHFYFLDEATHDYMLGRIYLRGCHTEFGELMADPHTKYQRVERPKHELLGLLNPPDCAKGVKFLTKAAERGYIPAQLALAGYYDTLELNAFEAEYWHVQALGYLNHMSPLAFTRYGLFLRGQGRFREALETLKVAASAGHSRGQYEYASLLLSSIRDVRSKDWVGRVRQWIGPIDERKRLFDVRIDAMKWLCEVSETGFYPQACILLAKTLIESAEDYVGGTANCVGRSPLPRAYQLLHLAKDSIVANMIYISKEEQDSQRDEVTELLSRYEMIHLRCSNCGEPGTESSPLLPCSFCGVLHYCGKLCRKKHFRSGHGADCCVREGLCRFEWIKRTMHTYYYCSPSTASDSANLHLLTNHAGQPPSPPASPEVGDTAEEPSLRCMVEDLTDKMNGALDDDYNVEHLSRLMLKMRKNLELFLASRMQDDSSRNLAQRINTFAQYYAISKEFKTAMDTIRQLGNIAAHSADMHHPHTATLHHAVCLAATKKFISAEAKFNAEHPLSMSTVSTQLQTVFEEELPEESTVVLEAPADDMLGSDIELLSTELKVEAKQTKVPTVSPSSMNSTCSTLIETERLPTGEKVSGSHPRIPKHDFYVRHYLESSILASQPSSSIGHLHPASGLCTQNSSSIKEANEMDGHQITRKRKQKKKKKKKRKSDDQAKIPGQLSGTKATN